jgi:hypothetical protein
MTDDGTRRLTILDLILLIAGLAVGLWLAIGVIGGWPPENEESWLYFLIFVLGGISLIGPPLLLRERFRGRVRLGLGEWFWFCQGTAAWLLWPPIIVHRFQDKVEVGRPMAGVCYAYGTPLMALYITLALLAGGWLRPRHVRRRARGRRRWTETFGLLVGLLWACTGLYVLVLIYRRDLFK